MGGLCPIVAPQARLIYRRWNVGAFDFKQRSRLALPEQTRAMGFLKTGSKIVQFIVRGHYALVLAVRGGTVILGQVTRPPVAAPFRWRLIRSKQEKKRAFRAAPVSRLPILFASDPPPSADPQRSPSSRVEGKSGCPCYPSET
jgi:hypothetical protein